MTNLEKVIDEQNLQSAQIKALRQDHERLVKLLDPYLKQMDASMGRNTGGGGNYISPLAEVLKRMQEVTTPRVKDHMRQWTDKHFANLQPGNTVDHRKVADWTHWSEKPQESGWYEVTITEGVKKLWFSHKDGIWYVSDNIYLEDRYEEQLHYWRPIASQKEVTIQLLEKSAAFHSFLKETKTPYKLSDDGAFTEITINPASLFWLGLAWGQELQRKSSDTPRPTDNVITFAIDEKRKQVTVFNNGAAYFVIGPSQKIFAHADHPGKELVIVDITNETDSFIVRYSPTAFYRVRIKDFITDIVAGRIREIAGERNRYFVTMPWGGKEHIQEAKTPPYSAPQVRLAPGQFWKAAYIPQWFEIRAFSRTHIIARIYDTTKIQEFVEVEIAVFRDYIRQGKYILSTEEARKAALIY